MSCASDRNSSRAFSVSSATLRLPAALARELAQHEGLERFFGERLRQVGIGAEGEAPLPVAIRRLRRDQHDGQRTMPLALANELHQLQPVDVGHVDVGDHEIVAATRQQAERVEAADRLDDLELAEFGLTLQSGAYEPPGGERIVYDQNARHGGPGLRARERGVTGNGPAEFIASRPGVPRLA